MVCALTFSRPVQLYILFNYLHSLDRFGHVNSGTQISFLDLFPKVATETQSGKDRPRSN